MTTRAGRVKIFRGLGELAPYALKSYLHNRTGEDYADARLKRQVMGIVVAVTNGRLDLGPREKVFYGDRQKRVLVKVSRWLHLLQLVQHNLWRFKGVTTILL
jgi:thiamine phosphate synthase YjbQ (UPF0047 family)